MLRRLAAVVSFAYTLGTGIVYCPATSTLSATCLTCHLFTGPLSEAKEAIVVVVWGDRLCRLRYGVHAVRI
jgi:hypothetical protein